MSDGSEKGHTGQRNAGSERPLRGSPTSSLRNNSGSPAQVVQQHRDQPFLHHRPVRHLERGGGRGGFMGSLGDSGAVAGCASPPRRGAEPPDACRRDLQITFRGTRGTSPGLTSHRGTSSRRLQQRRMTSFRQQVPPHEVSAEWRQFDAGALDRGHGPGRGAQNAARAVDQGAMSGSLLHPRRAPRRGSRAAGSTRRESTPCSLRTASTALTAMSPAGAGCGRAVSPSRRSGRSRGCRTRCVTPTSRCWSSTRRATSRTRTPPARRPCRRR